MNLAFAKVLSGYKLPCTTYVLFSPNLLPAAPRAEREEPVDSESHQRMWQPKRAQTCTRLRQNVHCMPKSTVLRGWTKTHTNTHTDTHGFWVCT